MDQKTKRPFPINNNREIYWIRKWFKSQIEQTRLPGMSYQAADCLDTAELVQSAISKHLDQDARRRLQKALSARRSRHEAAEKGAKQSPVKRIVQTEITLEARNILSSVATSKGLTTSELIIQLLEDDYLKLN